MRRLISILALVLVFILQLALSDLQLFQNPPNLVLVYLCVSLLFVSLGETLILALIGGGLLDIFSAYPDGVMVFSLFAAISLAYYLTQVFLTEKISSFAGLFYALLGSIFFLGSASLADYALSFLRLNRALGLTDFLSVQFVLYLTINLIALYPLYRFQILQNKINKKLSKKYESV